MNMPKKRKKRPKKGYSPQSIIDANRLDEEVRCEVCNRRLRWVHPIVHSELDHPVSVGCVCAAKMCLGYDAEGAETEAKNRTGRLQRFLEPSKWKETSSGSLARTYKGIRVSIFESYGQFRYRIKEKRRQPIFPHDYFQTRGEAMAGAFEWIEMFT
jgi:hypothetical protein